MDYLLSFSTSCGMVSHRQFCVEEMVLVSFPHVYITLPPAQSDIPGPSFCPDNNPVRYGRLRTQEALWLSRNLNIDLPGLSPMPEPLDHPVSHFFNKPVVWSSTGNFDEGYSDVSFSQRVNVCVRDPSGTQSSFIQTIHFTISRIHHLLFLTWMLF